MIKTAVILAGGRGERMVPVTNSQPKALVPINGVPILKLLISQLIKNGVDRIYVLTGHLGEQILDYTNTLNLGLKVTCINSDPNFTPGERLIKSLSLFKEDFLLLYCDNYIPDDEVIKKQLNASIGVTLLLHKREIGNISIKDDLLSVYGTKERKTKNPYVELGFISVRSVEFKNTLNKLRDINLVLEELSRSSKIHFNILTKNYLSLSNFNKYVDQNLHGNIMILDRDGIINAKMEKRKYLTSFENLKYIEKNLEIFSMLSNKGFNFIVATNQPGIATKEVSELFLVNLHQKITSDLRKYNINILTFYVCKHHWDDSCECRKPKPGMLNQAVKDFRLKSDNLIFIGDENTDLKAAEAAGINGIKFSSNDAKFNLSQISMLTKVI